jgi:hypothetical protein
MIDIDDGLLAPDDITFDFASLDLPDSGDLFDAPEWDEPLDDGPGGEDAPLPGAEAFTFVLNDGAAIVIQKDDTAPSKPQSVEMSDAELAAFDQKLIAAGLLPPDFVI